MTNVPPPPSPIKRKITKNLAAEAKKAPARVAHLDMTFSMYPLDAPGMPLPGPDFVIQAAAEGDTSRIESAKVKNEKGRNTTVKSVVPGEVLSELYRKALRETTFTMPIALRNGVGVRKVVKFVPGHIWNQGIMDYVHDKGAASLQIDGPRPANVMVIGKFPGKNEVEHGRNMIGESGKLLVNMLNEQHFQNFGRWYVTNLCKFAPPDGTSNLKAHWIDDCLPLLHQELRIVRPNYILCLGSDASKALLGVKHTVTFMEGRVMELTYPVNTHYVEDPEARLNHTSLVMSVIHPAAVDRDPTMRRTLERGLARFKLLSEGTRFDLAETDIDHRVIYTLEELENLLYEISNDPEWQQLEPHERWVAWDAEWHGEHPNNKGSYVRTLQFSWKEKCAAAIVLTEAGTGNRTFCDQYGEDARDRMVDLINQFTIDEQVRIIGHFLVADLEWICDMGLGAILEAFKVPLLDKAFNEFTAVQQEVLRYRGYRPGDNVEAWARTYVEGGWDTGLGAHAIEETAALGLEMLTLRYTTVPRYDVLLNEWKTQFCYDHKIKPSGLEGYGYCPDEVIVPYGNYDADGTRRLAMEQIVLVDDDYDHNNCRESLWESMTTVPVILEIHQTGIAVDKQLIDEHTENFIAARLNVEDRIRQWSKWQTFNIRSVQQVREFLFGEQYNGKRDKQNQIVQLRPPEAVTLGLDPLMDTSKPPTAWSIVRDKGLEAERNAGTGKTILGVLAQEHADRWGKDAQGQMINPVQWLRDYRFVDQALKSVLRPPVTDDAGNWVYEEDDYYDGVDTLGGFGGTGMGGLLYDAGLASCVCDDGRVRTHLYPTAETKRWKSARPNLQNISKRRDPDYKRILGEGLYKRKLRSIFVPIPGHVLVEADYTGAELFGMAIMAGDLIMIEHCRRNVLPDEGYDRQGNKVPGGRFPHPEHYDIHSNVAVLAFKLTVPAGNLMDAKLAAKYGFEANTPFSTIFRRAAGSPLPAYKWALQMVGKSQLRIAAKTVVFGLAYGRGAKAIAFEVKQEGVFITVEEAQLIIDAVLHSYRGLTPFFDTCKARVVDPRWMCSCFGAFRRFPNTDDKTVIAELERQAQNFPIQSMIASAMDRAIAYIQHYRDTVIGDPDYFKIILQIHDAVLLQVPYANVDRVVKEVIPYNMTDRVAIYPTDLSGVPTGEGPYHLGAATEVFHHWGEALSTAEAEKWGLPLEYAHAS